MDNSYTFNYIFVRKTLVNYKIMRTNLTIFLAEDDEDDALFFKEAMSDLLVSANITILIDGEELLKLLETNTILPDLIFLDLNMPKKNGYECLKEIKNNYLWKQIKTIILSTTSDTAQIKKCYFLGADTFITKASDFDEFKLNLGQCLL